MAKYKSMTRPFTLTERENITFQLFRGFIKANKDRFSPELHSIRVVGGWVRDKLLKRTGGDIDLTVDYPNGLTQFCQSFRTYCDKLPQSTLHHAFPTQGDDRIFKIKYTPPMESDLGFNTLKVVIYDTEFDLSDLRSNSTTYEQRGIDDAKARDFTINSIFYNVISDSLEDFTSHGIEDLEKGVLRTSNKVEKTMGDDAIRTLRGIRFISQFNYAPSPSFFSFLLFIPQNILEEMRTKISKERKKKEITKLFSEFANTNRSIFSIALLFYSSLHTCIFPTHETDHHHHHHYRHYFFHINRSNLFASFNHLLTSTKPNDVHHHHHQRSIHHHRNDRMHGWDDFKTIFALCVTHRLATRLVERSEEMKNILMIAGCILPLLVQNIHFHVADITLISNYHFSFIKSHLLSSFIIKSAIKNNNNDDDDGDRRVCYVNDIERYFNANDITSADLEILRSQSIHLSPPSSLPLQFKLRWLENLEIGLLKSEKLKLKIMFTALCSFGQYFKIGEISKFERFEDLRQYWIARIDSFAEWMNSLYYATDKRFLWEEFIYLFSSFLSFTVQTKVDEEIFFKSMEGFELNKYKPILNGHQIEELKLKRDFKEIKKELFVWELLNPIGTPDAAKLHLTNLFNKH